MCDVIKQNESELKNNEGLVFNLLRFVSYILLKPLSKLNVWFQRYSRFSPAKNNEIEHYYLLYLKINISKFRLILIDHITCLNNQVITLGIGRVF